MIKRLILLCIFASGCGLYWGDDKQDDCVYNGGPAGEGAPQGQRDPSTGMCDYNYGGGGYCDSTCGACPEADGADIPARDWGACNTTCDALDESTCIATAGCHAAYIDTGYDALLPSGSFYGCWQTAPQWDQKPASCTGLDAQSCSELDNCSMIYTADLETPTTFEQCVDESVGSCNEGQQCPMGSHCEQQCAPCNSLGCDDTCAATCVSDSTCDTMTCGSGSQCVEQCDSNGCAPTCVATGTDPGSCTGTIECNSAPPTCPANTTPGILDGCWSGYCIPNADCGSHDPGQCYAQLTCNSAPPSCPSGTLPGITNGCWSGYCIPTTGCELPACEALGSESACDARSDCTPVYTGTDCTCTLSGCTCATETYARCESLVMPL